SRGRLGLVLLATLCGPGGLGARQAGENLNKKEREALKRQAHELNQRMLQLHGQGQAAEAVSVGRKALAIRERLYPAKDYPDGHPGLAQSLNNLGLVLQGLGEPARALPYYQKALAMTQRLYPQAKYKDGHPDLAASLHNLGFVLQAMGQYAKALQH